MPRRGFTPPRGGASRERSRSREVRGRRPSNSDGYHGGDRGSGGGRERSRGSGGAPQWPGAAAFGGFPAPGGAFPGGFGCGGYPPGGCGAFGPCGFGGCWPGYGGAMQKKRKKKRKRGASESSSSSSSSSEAADDWRKKIWEQGFQGGGCWPQQMWPGMGGWPPPMGGAPGGCGSGPPGSAPPPPGAPPGAPPTGFGGASGSDAVEEREEPPADVPIFLEPAIEEYVPVPKALLGKVIGKQAQTIIEIREKSGAFKVDARDQSSDPCQVKIAGTAEAVKKAKALIAELLECTKSKHEGSVFVEIPKAKIGMVIGLKGSQVNEIQNETNTKIDVDFSGDPCKCYIKGNDDSVQRAKHMLLTIAMQIDDDSSEYIDLPKTCSGALIGSQGSRIREFQDQSGARIDIDKTGNKCRVRLAGTREQVDFAKALIMHELDKLQRAEAAKKPALPPPPEPIPAHQPTTFPATLSESIARAKAAAEAIKNGLITTAPVGTGAYDSFAGVPAAPMGMPVPPPMSMPVPPPPSSAPGAPRVVPAPSQAPQVAASAAAGGGQYSPW
eukprot:TRINITY_DN37029_c0_g1_i1.p1 TRINITY_DN37029_c0_g1~~TRINITY_DN37029_c0_g1_i1.p1  ORF type:complete len:555 (+),score=157.78 TRINITY_DN37029_c0_g1_i1:160-1824(+)